MTQRKPSHVTAAHVAQMDWLQDLKVPDLSAQQTLQWLVQWTEQGLLRHIDSALAAQLLRLDAQARPALLVATALLAQMEGRGHTCLPLDALCTPPVALLGWTAAAVDGPQGLHALWTHLPRTLPDWQLALQSASLRHADAPDHGQPLVLGGAPEAPLLYLRRYAGYEQRVGCGLLQRAGDLLPVPQVAANTWLDRFFAPCQDTGTDWQRVACEVALRARLAVITGGPGTGKTYTAARLLALLLAVHEGDGALRVALAAPTGKAAARLKQSIDKALLDLPVPLDAGLDLKALTQRMGPARTLHSLLGARPGTRAFRHHAAHLLDVDVLIVDEASMVHLEMMDALLQALPPSARLVLLGDKDQLASVEAGAVLGDLCQSNASALTSQIVVLRESRRFRGGIGRLALAVNRGDAAAARAELQTAPSALTALQASSTQAVCRLALGESGQASYADYLRCMRLGPQDDTPEAHAVWVRGVLRAFDRFRILCAVHRGDWGTEGLNAAVQNSLAQAGLLQPKGEWFAGRPVMVTRNDAQLGVFNGDVGVVLPGLDGKDKVWFLDGDALRAVSVMRLAQVETAFVMTVHKSQGSEFEHTMLVLPAGGAEVLSRELVYTGITRARERFTLVEAEVGLLEAALARPNTRASGLRRWWG